jgi:hypothetical protein
VASRNGTRRRELSRQSADVEKQESRRHASDYAYRDKEREERSEEEDRGPVVYAPPFLAGWGGGVSVNASMQWSQT